MRWTGGKYCIVVFVNGSRGIIDFSDKSTEKW